MGKNRIAKYIRNMEPIVAKVVIVSDIAGQKIALSLSGESLVWQWTGQGLLRPGTHVALDVHPLAAEVVAINEIEQLLLLEGIAKKEVTFVDAGGMPMDGAYLHPKPLGEPTYKCCLAKETLKELYALYVERGYKLDEGLIGQAIGCGALGAFLSLTNL